MYRILASLFLVPVLAWSATAALAQVTTETHVVDGRTFTCTNTVSGGQRTSQCVESNGPYKSTCVGPVGSMSENCSDNYGHTWDPSVTAAPPLPPASQPPGSAAPAPPAALAAPPPAAAGPCSYTLGFATLHDLAADVVGACVTNATPQANGDVQQQTVKGLLVWRKADNWTAFTNGATTWINGPQGLQSRPNSERFPWEPPGT